MSFFADGYSAHPNLFNYLNKYFISNADNSKHIVSMDCSLSYLLFVTQDGQLNIIDFFCRDSILSHRTIPIKSTKSYYKFRQCQFVDFESDRTKFYICLLTTTGVLLFVYICFISPQFPHVTTKEIPLTHPVVYFRYDDSLLLAIRQDGLLYLFADFSSVRFRQQEPMKSIPQFTIQFNQPVCDIGITGNTVYVLTTEGNLYSYGDPSKNLKPLSSSNPFHQVLSTDHFISIHSSHNNFIALASNGTVYLISHDKSFQNTSSFQVFSTSQITRINDLEVRKIIDVAVSNRNLVFITSDGEAYIHGYNDNAQCLTPTTSNFESLFHMAKPTCGLDQLHCYRAARLLFQMTYS